MSNTEPENIIGADCFVLFVCEGAAEEVIVKKLLEASILPIDADNVIDVTRTRQVKKIEERYFNVDYDLPVQIVRVLDSINEAFKSSKLYIGRYAVTTVCTRPEIEILVVLNEGRYDVFKKSKKKPSDFCAEDLGFSQVKSREFLIEYWDVESIVKAAEEYRRMHKFKPGELCLSDLWK